VAHSVLAYGRRNKESISVSQTIYEKQQAERHRIAICVMGGEEDYSLLSNLTHFFLVDSVIYRFFIVKKYVSICV
jgi:hypothetical protein